MSGSLADVLKGDVVFIGVSGRTRLIDKDMVQSMNSSPIVFALSSLPDKDALFALAVDNPLYFSVHSAYAKLTPEDGALTMSRNILVLQ